MSRAKNSINVDKNPDSILRRPQSGSPEQRALVVLKGVLWDLLKIDSEVPLENIISTIRKEFPGHRWFHSRILQRNNSIYLIKTLLKELQVPLFQVFQSKKF